MPFGVASPHLIAGPAHFKDVAFSGAFEQSGQMSFLTPAKAVMQDGLPGGLSKSYTLLLWGEAITLTAEPW